MRISVVIPLYNKEKHIGASLKSVLDQSYQPYEIIIINDGSSDKSLDIVSNFTHPTIKIHSQKNTGVAAARNLGIQLSRSNYIAFLDADDIWHKDFLLHIKEAVEEFPEHKIYASAIVFEVSKNIKHTASYTEIKKKPIQILSYFTSSLKHSLLYSSSIVVHKSIFDQLGYFNPKLKTGEDTDMWIRMGLKNDVVFISKPLSLYRYTSNSLSRAKLNFNTHLNPDTYLEQEVHRPDLHKFLNNLRFALTLQAKEANDSFYIAAFSKHLNKRELNFKQRFLLQSPYWSLKYFKILQKALRILGIQASPF